MSLHFRRNVSASTIQLVVNQGFGLLVFYMLSTGLAKEDFGKLNWALSLFLIVFSFLSFGIDQLIVKKVAADGNKSDLLSLHLLHVLFTGFLSFVILCLVAFLLAEPRAELLLLLIGGGKMLLFFSTPLKAVNTGAENFRLVMFMSVPSTVIKTIGIICLLSASQLTLLHAAIVFILADGMEFLSGFLIAGREQKMAVRLRFTAHAYFSLLKEAVPQMGVVFFTSVLTRLDWLLIGIFLTASKVAEYSFAYKAFELASLPLLAIAPLLVPAFSRMLVQGKKITEQDTVQLLFRCEMIVACFTSLCMNLLWTPLADALTNDNYGAVNAVPVFFLSVNLPVLYLNNFLWSIHFSHGRLRFIFFSFLLCFGVNLLGNLTLIPLLGTSGAAIAYLLSLAVQSLFYAKRADRDLRPIWQSFFLCSICALAAGSYTKFSSLSGWQVLPCSIVLYFLLLLGTFQIRKEDWLRLRQAMTV